MNSLASVPGGLHDDCVDAISQALNRLRDSGRCFGLLDLIKDLSTGKRKMPAAAEEILRVDASKRPNDKCPACQSTATIWQSDGYGGRMVHCNQRGRNDSKDSSEPPGCAPGCPALVKQFAGGRIRCGNCGRYQDQASAAIGMSRADYAARRGFGQGYGRFRR
jgi:hypothetical protein